MLQCLEHSFYAFVERARERYRLRLAGCIDLIRVEVVAVSFVRRLDAVGIHLRFNVAAAALQRHGRVAAERGVVAAQRVGQLLEAGKRPRARRRLAARPRQTEHDAHEHDDHHRHDQ